MGRSAPVIALCTAGAVLAGAAACQRSPREDRGNLTVRIAAAVPTARIPGAGVNALVQRLTTERLLSMGGDGRPRPALADNWAWDPSHTRLRLTLHEGVLFHDGTKLTAAIAAQSVLNTLRDSPPPSFENVESIEPVDARTIEIRLRRPDGFLPEDLTFANVDLPNQHQTGSGPFVRVDSATDRIRLRAFPDYYRGRPALDNLEVDVYPTQRNAWAAMLRDQADVLYEVSRDALEFVQAETRVKTYSFPRPYSVALGFNVRQPALKNPAVRRAINRAIDRELLVKEGLRGQGRPADGPIWPEHWAYSQPRHPLAYDPDAARRELDLAGFPMRPSAVSGGMPQRLSFTCLVYHEDARFERTALLIQKQLYDVGIDMKLQPVGLLEIAKLMSTGQFDAFLFELVGGRYLGWAYTFWHSGTGQKVVDGGYHAADDALERLRRATSDEGVRQAAADLNDVFSSDPPAAFLAWQSQTRAASRRVAIPDEPNADILSTGVHLWTLRDRTQVVQR